MSGPSPTAADGQRRAPRSPLPDPQAGVPPANHHLWRLMVARANGTRPRDPRNPLKIKHSERKRRQSRNTGSEHGPGGLGDYSPGLPSLPRWRLRRDGCSVRMYCTPPHFRFCAFSRRAAVPWSARRPQSRRLSPSSAEAVAAVPGHRALLPGVRTAPMTSVMPSATALGGRLSARWPANSSAAATCTSASLASAVRTAATKCSSPSPVASAACVPVATRTDLLLAAWQTKVFELLVAAEKIDRQTVDQMRSWAALAASASTTASTCRRATLQAWSVWRSTSCAAPSAWPAWSA